MRLAIVAFALGVWLLERQPALPEPAVIGVIVLAALAMLLAAWRVARSTRLAAGIIAAGAFALGFAWAAGFAQLRLADRLDPELEGRDVVVTGVIASLPQPFERGVRFEFDIESAPAGVPDHALVSWYNGFTQEEFQEVAPVRAGERWRFTVRLRRPYGSANPHGFDYEAWLLERGIRATGYVRPKGERERLARFVHRPQYWIEHLREAIREKFWEALPGERYAGVLIALAIGDQRAIEPDEWQMFARTGVSHLMSISGLHVTMVAGLFAVFVGFLWRRSEALALRLPAQKAAALAGFLAALGYCLLSGYAVPAQRTLYMVGVVALALWLGRASSASRVLALALLIVLILDPWAVPSPGFWLSFGAVALIFHVGIGRTSRPHWLSQWGSVQWAITIGLAPLLLVLFQQVSLVSPIANAIAIPLVSLVITPLALAGAVLPAVAPFDWPLVLANFLVEALMVLLAALAAVPGAVWQQHAPLAWTLPLGLLGIAWMLLPRGVPARWLGVPLLLPMFAIVPPGPRTGELWITVFDVGQGLAVLARTERHALLYDAGPMFNAFADSGSRVILPYLRGEGLARLDALVVSHDDNDHSGGAASVLAALPVGVFWSSLRPGHALMEGADEEEGPGPIQRPQYRLPCLAGRSWRWDGISFEFLHPDVEALDDADIRANDRSCVLRIAGEHGSVLLTGDMEWRAERVLLERAPGLSADVLLVPHHGSTTSSTTEFVQQVAPRYAIFTVGYRNRFGHPKDEVVRRYREAGSALVRTDESGAVLLRFGADGLKIRMQRDEGRRYWQGR